MIHTHSVWAAVVQAVGGAGADLSGHDVGRVGGMGREP